MGNVDKHLSHFKSIELSFGSSEHVHNIASNAVLSESIASDIANQQSIGKSIWICLKGCMERKAFGTLQKMGKLQTFKSAGVMIKTKIEGKLFELKEDNQLLQRVLAI